MKTNEPQGGGLGEYNSKHCKTYPLNAFTYSTSTQAERQNVIDFYNLIPNGHYVVFYTQNDYNPELWESDLVPLGTTIFDIMESQGAMNIRNTIAAPVPYSFFFRKNTPSFTPQEAIGATVDSYLDNTYQVPGNWDSGEIYSTMIGPAEAWQSLHWRTSSLDNIPNDNYSIDIIGIQSDETEVSLYSGLTTQDTSLTYIDADIYPYLRLEFHSEDLVDRTSIQLDYWRVLYDELPEAALRPDLSYSFQADTLNQGEELSIEIASQNISAVDMDSLLVKFTIVDNANNITDQFTRQAPLAAWEQTLSAFTYNTTDLGGLCKAIVEINPNEDQPELYALNNIGVIPFYVQGDILNPLLDVTFDGRHIIDGDIVSAKPNILVTLTDENEYLELGDTSLFQVLLKYPNEADVRPVFFADPAMTFYPADPNLVSTENRAQIELNPHLLESGLYELIVQAEDVSGNQSGSLDYKVAFQVITESTISNVMNYPNPFTTSTQFVFTLTGEELPDYMKIQIMTVTGKVVREITMDELGPIHIGNNRTEFAWNGTDEFGDQLANGVYLYRVVARKNNEDMNSFATPTSQYFKNGIGKMYLMR